MTDPSNPPGSPPLPPMPPRPGPAKLRTGPNPGPITPGSPHPDAPPAGPSPKTVDRARVACGVARAWQQGHRLGALLVEHDVPAPKKVFTDQSPHGVTTVWAHMGSAADLFRLAYGAKASLQVCRTSPYTGHEQAYLEVGYGSRREVTALWAGPVSERP